jgi:stearoyl-CoA desaturase (delta-9 desaturase)
LALFIALAYGSLLIGHSVGMHRLMIHRTFACPKPLERLLVYIGVLVGVAGPFGVIKIHDTRDWAQRQPACHDFFSHKRPLLQDLIWQLAYRFEFARAPKLRIEPHFGDDPYYRFMESTWRLHQLALAVVLFFCGGWSWVIWGVCVRVIVSAAGHWTITYYCHNPGPQRWLVKGASVQASNMPGWALLSHGECWHNNHHAFPESARVGLEPGQLDPAWIVISLLQKCGLASNVGAPRSLDQQDDLIHASSDRISSSAVVDASGG